MPSTTSPKGANPCESRLELSPKLMKSWVVREFGAPVFAKVIRPRVLLSTTGSSLMRALRQRPVTRGSACMPNCAMKPWMTRKKATSS